MSVMLAGFLSSYVGINVCAWLFLSKTRFEVMVYWNATCIVYLLLNIVLVLILNFVSYSWVNLIIIRFCFVEEVETTSN